MFYGQAKAVISGAKFLETVRDKLVKTVLVNRHLCNSLSSIIKSVGNADVSLTLSITCPPWRYCLGMTKK